MSIDMQQQHTTDRESMISEAILRESFENDVSEELRAAITSLQAGRKPTVDLLGFQFWVRHYPQYLNDLQDVIQQEWRHILEHAFAGRAANDLFRETILPALSPKPADTTAWEDQALRAIVRAEMAVMPSDPPLSAADFLVRPVIEGDSKYLAMVRRHPLIFRAHNNVDRYPTPFAQRGDGFEMGEGWLQPMERFSAWLDDLAKTLKCNGGRQIPFLCQAKSKFGLARVYVDNVPDMLREVLNIKRSELEEETAATCERCGEAGKLRGIEVIDGEKRATRGWVSVLCDVHEAEYQAGLTKR